MFVEKETELFNVLALVTRTRAHAGVGGKKTKKTRAPAKALAQNTRAQKHRRTSHSGPTRILEVEVLTFSDSTRRLLCGRRGLRSLSAALDSLPSLFWE